MTIVCCCPSHSSPNLYTGEAQYMNFDAGSPVVIFFTEVITNLILKKPTLFLIGLQMAVPWAITIFFCTDRRNSIRKESRDVCAEYWSETSRSVTLCQTVRDASYALFSRVVSPSASACFLALSRRSAMLEFLECKRSWWTAARAANPSGYCGWQNTSGDELDDMATAAAAYWKEVLNIKRLITFRADFFFQYLFFPMCPNVTFCDLFALTELLIHVCW